MAARAHASGTLFSALFSSMSFLIVVTCISLLSLSLAVCNHMQCTCAPHHTCADVSSDA
jgi:hypothetical protein